MKNQLVIHDAKLKRWLLFQNPDKIIIADRIDRVVPQLQLVNDLIVKHQMYGAGFISYEASSAFDWALKTHFCGDFPLLWFGLYHKPEVIDLPKISLADDDYIFNWTPSVSQDKYEEAIAIIKEYIARGQTYQVNYSIRLNAPFQGNDWDFFLKLIQGQASDYGAYVDIDKYTICSASPELFFRLSGNELTCRPMKGTSVRGLKLDEDLSQAKWLKESEKNRAENLMIVDMIRNDMGRVAELNTVKVPSLFDVEQYPTLWQMTSTVTAKTQASISEIIAALFPCASITGAPKPSTMAIIRELETTPRRIYTGSIGFISPHRQVQFNVAIRTAIFDKETGQVEYSVGGGIVWDSAIADEYQECKFKAKVLTENRPIFSLLETMLWHPDEGYFLLDYHVKRLQESAIYFGFQIDIDRIKSELNKLPNSLENNTPYKVRLLVTSHGEISCETTPISPLGDSQVIKLAISPTPVNSHNPFLYHKTTNRQVYESAKSACPQGDDVLLWNERGEVTETCIGNIIVELNGELLTPPIKCGLLAGTFRAELLLQGKIREEILTMAELKECDRLYVVNSVQKWRTAVLIPS